MDLVPRFLYFWGIFHTWRTIENNFNPQDPWGRRVFAERQDRRQMEVDGKRPVRDDHVPNTTAGVPNRTWVRLVRAEWNALYTFFMSLLMFPPKGV